MADPNNPQTAKRRAQGKSLGGRPTKYKPEYCQEIINFFDIDPSTEVEVKFVGKDGKEWSKFEERANRLPFLSAFARKIGVTHETLLEWCRVHPEFSVAFSYAKGLQAEMLHGNALMGLYNPAYARLAAINITDWKSEKQEHEHSGQVSLLPPQIT